MSTWTYRGGVVKNCPRGIWMAPFVNYEVQSLIGEGSSLYFINIVSTLLFPDGGNHLRFRNVEY